jgi:hypothetical protein
LHDKTANLPRSFVSHVIVSSTASNTVELFFGLKKREFSRNEPLLLLYVMLCSAILLPFVV